MPVGEGIGATQVACEVMSLTRAAGSPPIMTFDEPMVTVPGPPGTQLAKVHGVVVLVTVAAGCLPINTVAIPVIMVNGIAGCGTGVGTGAAG